VYTLVRRFIKTAIFFLFAGLLLGGYVLVRRELFGDWPNPYLVSAHTHAVLVGFVMFLILGVALWLFPRAAKEDTRYRPERVEAAYWILVVSTGARFVAEALRGFAPIDGIAWVVVAGGLGQILGLAVYFWTMWTRIRPVGSHIREGRGERF
jgi:heme/copper-type cytochrome/quinol oxidase subunit 1